MKYLRITRDNSFFLLLLRCYSLLHAHLACLFVVLAAAITRTVDSTSRKGKWRRDTQTAQQRPPRDLNQEIRYTSEMEYRMLQRGINRERMPARAKLYPQ